MSDTTTITWRYALGERVRWTGDGQVWTIRERGVIESRPGRLLVDYYLVRDGQEPGWVREPELEPHAAEPPSAGEGGG